MKKFLSFIFSRIGALGSSISIRKDRFSQKRGSLSLLRLFLFAVVVFHPPRRESSSSYHKEISEDDNKRWLSESESEFDCESRFS